MARARDHIGILRLTDQFCRRLFRRLLGRHRPAITGPIFLEQIAFPLHDGPFKFRPDFGPSEDPLSTDFPHVHHIRLLAETEFSQRIQKMGFPAIPIGATLP